MCSGQRNTLQVKTETEMSSLGRTLYHWPHCKLSKCRLSVQPVAKMSSNDDGTTFPFIWNTLKQLQLKTILCWGRKRGHDDVIKWQHFPRYWPFVRGIHRSPVDSMATHGFFVFFDLRLKKRMSKLSGRWWFETPSRLLWRHCNGDYLDSWFDLSRVNGYHLRISFHSCGPRKLLFLYTFHPRKTLVKFGRRFVTKTVR